MDSSEQLIISYLAYFNQIDKHFDKLLGLDNFLPYNEKIKRITQMNFPISWFVNLHKYELKFMWELRNHITHGIKLDGHNYAVPSNYALTKIQHIAEQIKNPPSCISLFEKNVYTANQNSLLVDILPVMTKYSYTHIPIYSEQRHFVGVLTEHNICERLSSHIQTLQKTSIDTVCVADIQIETEPYTYAFVSWERNIYEIDELFSKRKSQHNRIGAIFITHHGDPKEKILGVITSWDIAIVDSYILH